MCDTAPHPPGKLTLPRTLLTDSRFHYTRADKTDVASTIKREQQRLQAEALQRQLQPPDAQPQLPGLIPIAKPMRPRAGMGQHLALPSL